MPRQKGTRNKAVFSRFQVRLPAELESEIRRAALAENITPSKAARRFLVAGLAAKGIRIDPDAAKIA